MGNRLLVSLALRPMPPIPRTLGPQTAQEVPLLHVVAARLSREIFISPNLPTRRALSQFRVTWLLVPASAVPVPSQVRPAVATTRIDQEPAGKPLINARP